MLTRLLLLPLLLGLALCGAVTLAGPEAQARPQGYAACFGSRPDHEIPDRSIEIVREWSAKDRAPVMLVLLTNTKVSDAEETYRNAKMGLFVISTGSEYSVALVLKKSRLPRAKVYGVRLTFDGRREKTLDFYPGSSEDEDLLALVDEKDTQKVDRALVRDLVESRTMRVRIDSLGLDRTFAVGKARKYLTEQRDLAASWR
ncbi:MAG: hypothetical protein Q4F72_05860 [Desulfovibrionaceae bacterium]|nr:hypothetical protein [Desulfovibrionaceae bacterium]